MKKISYKEQIKLLCHKHTDTTYKITEGSFYYSNPNWPDFVLETSEYYQQPIRKIIEDLSSYRNSFAFQKEKSFYKAILEKEEA